MNLEKNVLFNDALNIFYLLLYSLRHMVKDHSYSERGNLQPSLHRLLFWISSKGSFVYAIPQTTYYGLWYTSRGALTKCSSVVYHGGSIRRPIAPLAVVLLRPDIALLFAIGDTGERQREPCQSLRWSKVNSLLDLCRLQQHVLNGNVCFKRTN